MSKPNPHPHGTTPWLVVEHQRLSSAVDRLVTIIDEAFGMQPVQPIEDLLSFLESELFREHQLMEQAATKWEELEKSAANICGHCRVPVSVEDLPTHLRSCEKSPIAAENAALRTLLGRAHGAITRCERTSQGREAAKVLDDIDVALRPALADELAAKNRSEQ